MEPMRPVDVGRQAPPRLWWQRWGRQIPAGITILVVLVLRITVEIPLWVAAFIGLALGMVWLGIEKMLTRRLAAGAEAESELQ